jgi:chemosensory pili system protein ChpA (sensor histidine kinase/response regulator)
MRVLVVDDSLSVRKVAEKVLVGLGVDVTLAVDGVDALARLRAESFDLVFTDLEMPRLHGYELIREIRFLPKLKTLPVVVVSSRSGAKYQEQARSLGATDYVTKPFTAQILDVILKRYVKLDGAQNG